MSGRWAGLRLPIRSNERGLPATCFMCLKVITEIIENIVILHIACNNPPRPLLPVSSITAVTRHTLRGSPRGRAQGTREEQTVLVTRIKGSRMKLGLPDSMD